jgi:hypothetical protein
MPRTGTNLDDSGGQPALLTVRLASACPRLVRVRVLQLATQSSLRHFDGSVSDSLSQMTINARSSLGVFLSVADRHFLLVINVLTPHTSHSGFGQPVGDFAGGWLAR